MARRYELHEWQWQLIRDLFPPPKATGRKRRDPRQMLDAIFWILCPDVLDIVEIISRVPPQDRPDQIIGSESWARALGRSSEEGWILDEDQLERHKDHIHLGYIRNDGTWNVR